MKKAVVFLSIVSVCLVAVLWRNQKSAGGQLQQAADAIASLSNQLATAEIKLNHQERMNAALGGQLTNNAGALKKSADNLAVVRDRLTQSQIEIRSLRDQLQSTETAMEAAKAEATGLSSQIETMRGELRDKDSQLARAREQSVKAEAIRQEVARQLIQVQLENDKLNGQLRNPALLRAQLDAQEKRLAAAKRPQSDSAPPDLKLNLELQPDGSVRVLPPPTTQEMRELEQELREKLEREP